MTRRLGELALFLALIAVVGWPALATFTQAIRDYRDGVEHKPIENLKGAAAPVYTAPMAMGRPIRLAVETIKLVALTEFFALPLGVAIGFVVFRTNAFGHRALLALIGVSLFVPMPLHALAWLGSFGNAGRLQALGNDPILTGLFGAAFVHAMAALPWVAVISGVGMRTVERELEETAMMDLPVWRVFWRVTFRRSLGAIAGSALAVAVLTASDMTVTDLLQVRTFAEEAYIRGQLGVGQGAAAAVVSLPMFLTLGVLIAWAARAILAAEPERLPSAQVAAMPFDLGRWRIPVGLFSWITAGTLVGLPTYGLVWRAGWIGRIHQARRWSPQALLRNLGASWTELTTTTTVGPFFETLTSRPLVGSLLWAAVGAVFAVALAWPLAWFSRDSRFWRAVAAIAVALTLAAPGPVAGVALKLAYFDVPMIHNTSAILVLAYVLRTFPYCLLIVWPSVRGIASPHLESATLDGLTSFGRAWKIGLPMTRPAIVAAWVAALVLSLGELPSAYFVSQPGYDPLARVVWGMLHTGVESRLAAIGLILIVGVAAMGAAAVAALSRTLPR